MEYYSGPIGGSLVDSVVAHIKASGNKGPVPMLALRAMANLCRGSGASAFNETIRCESLIRLLGTLATIPDSNIQQANSALMINLCVAKNAGTIVGINESILLQVLKSVSAIAAS